VLSKRSFSLAGHRTSIALEPEFWDALAILAEQAGVTLSALIARLDGERSPQTRLASTLRVFALRHSSSVSGGSVSGGVVSGSDDF
jgi:predicted DNA-binding ribbon-helix-helix protein